MAARAARRHHRRRHGRLRKDRPRAQRDGLRPDHRDALGPHLHVGLRRRRRAIQERHLLRRPDRRDRRRGRGCDRAGPPRADRQGSVHRCGAARGDVHDARRVLHGLVNERPAGRASGQRSRLDGSAQHLPLRGRGAVDRDLRAQRRGVGRAEAGPRSARVGRAGRVLRPDSALGAPRAARPRTRRMDLEPRQDRDLRGAAR